MIKLTSVAKVVVPPVRIAIISAALPVIVATAVATTVTLVIPSTVTRFAASADVSVTVIVRALFVFASVSVVSVARSPLEIVAVIAPVVSASKISA